MLPHSPQQDEMARRDNSASPGPMIHLGDQASSMLSMQIEPCVRENLVRLLNDVIRDVRSRAESVEFPWDDSHYKEAAKAIKRILGDGDNEKRFITLKLLHYIQSHKTIKEQNEDESKQQSINKRQKERARRRQGELLVFFQSLAAEIKSLPDMPSDPTFNFSDLEHEVTRFRRFARKVSPPLHFTHRTLEKPTGGLFHVNSLALSLDKSFLLSLALVPDPDDCPDRYESGKTVSPHIFSLAWPKSDTKPSTPVSQQTPGSSNAWVRCSSGLQVMDTVHIKQEFKSDADEAASLAVCDGSAGHRDERAQMDEQQGLMVGSTKLPKIVMEIGHLAIVHPTSIENKDEATVTATGIGLFVDLSDHEKGLWLLRTNDYIAVKLEDQPPVDPCMEAFLKKLGLHEAFGNFKLSRTMHAWVTSLSGEQQMRILQSIGSIRVSRRRLVPKFETFLTSPA